MAIEKMTFIHISGHTDRLDDVLILCTRCGVFQPEYASKLSEYSIGSTALLRNPYGALSIKINEIASQLGIKLSYNENADLPVSDFKSDEFIEKAHLYLNEMRKEYPQHFQKKREVQDELVSYTTAMEMLSHMETLDIDFDQLWENQFLKLRFGRMPTQNINKLSTDQSKPYQLHKLDEQNGETWCLYMTAQDYREDIDKMFFGLGFKRLRIPDYVHGTTYSAKEFISYSIAHEQKMLEESNTEIEGFITQEKDRFLALYSRVHFLYTAYNLRKYAVSIREHFHVVGFVPNRQRDNFLKLFVGISSLSLRHEAAGLDPRMNVPISLKNNWLVRPFEMFVTMYGYPSYGDIDPTPFVAYTYSILFGIMFGDVGHGLCVLLAGLLMWRLKGMALGRILTRVGISSMFFGFCYGSVFGFEHLLDPVFRAMGFHEKPIEVMHPDTTNKILIVAVALGAVIILMSMIFNIVIGIKRKNVEQTLFSSNGICGLIFYSALLLGVVSVFAGNSIISAPYIIGLIALPLLLIFFKEPIGRYISFVSKDTEIQQDTDLMETSILDQPNTNIPELFCSPFMTARFGRIPTDSYRKLVFYADEPFMLYPVKTDSEYIWLIYAMAFSDKPRIDAIFHDLFFERIYIPQEDMQCSDSARNFIKSTIDNGGLSAEDKNAAMAELHQRRTLYNRMFPEGFGAFFMETFFEMFEVLLSFVSNTISFLRVGGFVLVHAGMMSVVFTLSSMAASGAGVAILVIGNLFVMCLEGLIVGIQVLRLEFYEMFSRFYEATGEPFSAVTVRSDSTEDLH